MSNEEGELMEGEEETLAKHRREKKELQAKIQQMKKTVNKDKKKKKEVLEEINQMEREMKERHERELAGQREVEEVKNEFEGVKLEEEEEEEEEEEKEEEEELLTQRGKGAERKMSKAEKRRQKKAEANREREARIKEEEANTKNCARNVEADKLKRILRQRHLRMYEIDPDGNCMYAAIAHQAGPEITVPLLRSKAGEFIRERYEDFAPFITDPKTGDMVTREQFEEYCDLIVNTPAWGGQPELRALSQALKRRIEVLQAEGTPIIFGEEWSEAKTIHLAYYRHYYGLGEHYNSVTPLTTTTTTTTNTNNAATTTTTSTTTTTTTTKT